MNRKALPMSNIEKEFRESDSGWVAAYLQGDTALFDRIWIDGFIFTFPSGQFTNKEREIANLETGALELETLSTAGIRVKVYGKTAVMTGRFIMKGRYKDRDISGLYSYTDVLRKQQEKCWQIVSSHAAHIA